MKGDRKVIEFLNAVLRNELAAINQYFLHSRMFQDWGLTKLAEKEYEESIDEMKHADQLIQRILFVATTTTAITRLVKVIIIQIFVVNF